MTPPTKKRKLPGAPGPEAKRAKRPALRRGAAKTGPKAEARTQAAGRVVDVAALAWRAVGEEDFGGLEVISGVDVVKDAREGVRFVVCDGADRVAAGAGGGDGAEEAVDGDGTEGAVDDEEEEPFEGFSDDAVEGEAVHLENARGAEDAGAGARGGRPDAAEAKAQQKEGQATKQQKKKNKAAAAAALQTPAAHKAKVGSGGNAFAALADAQDDDGDAGVDVAAWVALNLSPRMLSAIAKLGFATPTAIQEKAIPEILAGGDVIGKAQTGSGKTLAFGIPMVDKWLELHDGDGDGADGPARTEGGPMALVLSPTRELAKQLGDHLEALCGGLPSAPYICVVTGGLSIQKQRRQLERADIVIGTPGRLWELMDGDSKMQSALARIEFLVVDEADRLFKAGQFKEAESIIGALDRRDPDADDEPDTDDEADQDAPARRQTLVFSATLDKELQTRLAGKAKRTAAAGDEDKMAYLMKRLRFRRAPRFIDANPVSQMPAGLREGLIECGNMERDLFLYTLLLLNPGRRTLVFANSVSTVRRLAPLLQTLQLPLVLALHSHMAQKARLRSVERFAAQPNAVLVATDVAARGLDIPDVDHVVHYHVPQSADTYIHRSGRTARGHRSGVSVMLCSPDEVVQTRRLAAKVHAAAGSAEPHALHALPVDRHVASRLRPRVAAAKRITEAVLAKERGHSEDKWLREAAGDMGVDYDADEFEQLGRAGRGAGRRRKEKEAQRLTKAEMGALRAQLREELSRRVNLGVSERYIAGGRVDVGALLRERESGADAGVFLGGDNVGLRL